MRDNKVWYNAGDSLEGESFDAKARKIYPKSITRKHNKRTITGKRIRLEGTAYAEIKADPTPGYVIGDALSAEVIIAEADKVQVRPVTKGSSRDNIQQRGLHSNVFCVITRPLRLVRES